MKINKVVTKGKGMVNKEMSATVEFFFSSRRRHTRSLCDWSSDVCSSDLTPQVGETGIWTANPSTGISFMDATQFDTDVTIARDRKSVV